MSLIKKYLSAIVLLIIFNSCTKEEEVSINIMTYNIRVDIPNQGVNSWEKRKNLIIKLVDDANPDIIGVQEALKNQITDIIKVLDKYAWIGVPREDGKNSGEYTAILYKRNRFEILSDSTFWLAEISETPTIGWDAAYKRTVTYAKIIDNYSNSIFYVYNTHFDHIGTAARFESANLILGNISRTVETEPIVLLGDFNCTVGSDPFNILTSNKKINLINTENISETKHVGSVGTFTGFDILAKPIDPIDFIFVSPSITIKNHKTLDQTINNKLPSDHYPVITEIILN